MNGSTDGRSRPGSPPAAAPRQISDVIMQIGTDLRARESEIIDAMTRRIARDVPDTNGNPQLANLRAASIRANMTTVIDILAENIPIQHLAPPAAAVECARREAQWDIPPNLLVRSYYMGQNAMMRICHDAVGQRQLPVDLGLAVIERITDIIHSYTDWITLYLFETYEVERKRWESARGTAHSAAVHALLAASDPDPLGFEAETGYRLNRTHLAVIAWYTGKADALTIIDSGVRTLAKALKIQGPPLVTAIDPHTAWAWYPFDRRPAVDAARLRSVATLPSDVHLAVGLPGLGVDGLRRSHRQATSAHFVATMPGVPPDQQVIGFDDPGVAAVSLLTKDIDATREWVLTTLGALAYDTDQAKTLRETLATFYETGESHAHTARKMTLHRNTVKYRISKALAATPVGPSAHVSLDIALALRVCRFLDSRVLQPPL